MKGGDSCGMNGGRRRKRTLRGGSGYGFQLDQDGGVIGAAGGNWSRVDGTAPPPGGPRGVTEGGRRRRRGSRKTRRVVKKKSVATIKRLLKAKGLKVSGSRRALTARARKARIPMKGGMRATAGGSYVGAGNAGLTNLQQYTQELPGGGGVMPMPDVNDGGYYQNRAGGLTPA